MKQLLFSIRQDDCEWGYFRGSGNGGQKKQKTSSGVWCKHPPSGAKGECSENRSQLINKRTAFKRMASTLDMKRWIFQKSEELKMGKTMEKWADEQCSEENIKVEVKDENGKWILETQTI